MGSPEEVVSYLAIARKYRPATFADMVGQEHVVRTLENALRTGRIHHAYLFCGARGVGKTTAARALAKALNCVEGPTAAPCGVCGSCVEISAGSSPDLVEIDGASNNSVEDVRELRETVGYAPTRGRYKVYLVDEVHMLSKAAFNALLKTLEEPPPHVVFLFATTEPNRILDTILSRVQRFDFKRIPLSATVDRLRLIAGKEGATLSDNALRMIARSGEGSMRDAQSLLDKVISFSGGVGAAPTDAMVAETLGLVDRSLLFGFLEGLVTGDAASCLEVIAAVYDFGHELSEFTSELLELLRHATFVRLSEEAARHVDLSADEVQRLRDLVAHVPPETLTRIFHALLEIHDQVSRASRPRVVLEMAVARLATTRPVEPVSALLVRLEDLERRLRAGGASPPKGPAGGSTSRRTPERSSFRESRVATARPAREEAAPPLPAPEPVVVKPDPVVVKPDPVAVKPDPVAVKPDPVAVKPDPVVAVAAPVVTMPVAAAEPTPPAAARAPRRTAPSRARAEPPPDDIPPIDDAELQRMGSSVAPERSAPASGPPSGAFPEAWGRVRARLLELGHERLAQGSPEVRGATLRIALPAGIALAKAKRSRDQAEVQGLLRTAFPAIEQVELVPTVETASPAETLRALRQEVLDDPGCQRIITRLGAELESVTNLRDT